MPSVMHKCWPDYNQAPMDTSSWDCSLNSLSAPPSDDAIAYLNAKAESGALEYGEVTQDPSIEKEVTNRAGKYPSVLFEKRYDANYSPSKSDHFPPMMRNELQGTCQAGQLSLRGYEQHKQNGIHLRNAYVKSDADGLNVDTDPSKILYDWDVEKLQIPSTTHAAAYHEPHLYFRSDDTQATIMSGQALLQSLFGDLMKFHSEVMDDSRNPVLRIHTADFERDILKPNHKMCPVLSEIEKVSKKSEPYYLNFLHSNEALFMMELANEFMGGWYHHEDPVVAMECIMTAICSDRTVPYVLNIDESRNDENLYNRFGNDWADRYFKFQSRRKMFPFIYSNAQYAEIVSTPLWNDILSGLVSFTNANQSELLQEWPDLRPNSKLALYSAHDTTLMALLASLGSAVFDGTEHPPYASMLNIELYELDFPKDASTNEIQKLYPSSVAFRLIYNGQVMTKNISGCPPTKDICDIDILILHVYGTSNVSDYDEICQLDGSEESSIPNHDGSGTPKKDFNNGAEMYEILVTGLVCTLSGAISMFLFMSQKQRNMARPPTEQDELMEVSPPRRATRSWPNGIEIEDDDAGNMERKNLFEIAQTSPTAAII